MTRTCRAFHTRTPTKTGEPAVLNTTDPTHEVNTSTIPLVSTPRPAGQTPTAHGCVLLRKEVIQPHLPVRLPCYDFVPIASPTFDHSLPCHKGEGLGHGLRVLPTFVT